MSHGKIGIVLTQEGKTAEALEEFATGRATIAELKQQFPANASFADDLAWFDARIAKLNPQAPQPEQAAQ